MNIEIISNGYLVTDRYGRKESFLTIQGLFEHLLLALEGKAECFGGSLYGKVSIDYKEPKSKQS